MKLCGVQIDYMEKRSDMYEMVVALDPENAFQQLKKALLKEKAKIIEEDPPKKLVAEHGSWIEYSPNTLQKIIKFNFVAEGSRTRIISDTSWKESSMIIGILSIIVAAVMGMFLLWLSWDIRAYIEGLRSTLAGSLLEWLGYSGYTDILRICPAIEILAFTLFAISTIAIIHTIYLYSKREEFAKRILVLLPREQ